MLKRDSNQDLGTNISRSSYREDNKILLIDSGTGNVEEEEEAKDLLMYEDPSLSGPVKVRRKAQFAHWGVPGVSKPVINNDSDNEDNDEEDDKVDSKEDTADHAEDKSKKENKIDPRITLQVSLGKVCTVKVPTTSFTFDRFYLSMQPAKQVSWHHRGDYFSTVAPDAGKNSVMIHQLSQQRTQVTTLFCV